MDEEDYACDKFISQKWRKDICKLCFQPKRLHEKKVKKIANKPEATDIVNNELLKLSSSENLLEIKHQEPVLPEITSSNQSDQVKEVVPISGHKSHETVTLIESRASLDTNALAMEKKGTGSLATCTGEIDHKGDHLLEASDRNIAKVTAPLTERDTTPKSVESPSDHEQLVSASCDEDSSADVAMHTSAVPPSVLETLQADSCVDEEKTAKTEVNIQEVSVRTEGCDSEEVKQKQSLDNQEKINSSEIVKQEGLLDSTGGQNEGSDIKDVTSNSKDKEITEDHEIKEGIDDYEEVKQKEQGLDVNRIEISYSEEVKHKEVSQDACVREDTLSFEDIGHQEFTTANVQLSDHTVLHSPRPDDEVPYLDENVASPPALAAANYPSNIPIPPPPPPIRGSSSAPVSVQSTLLEVSPKGVLMHHIVHPIYP